MPLHFTYFWHTICNPYYQVPISKLSSAKKTRKNSFIVQPTYFLLENFHWKIPKYTTKTGQILKQPENLNWMTKRALEGPREAVWSLLGGQNSLIFCFRKYFNKWPLKVTIPILRGISRCFLVIWLRFYCHFKIFPVFVMLIWLF